MRLGPYHRVLRVRRAVPCLVACLRAGGICLSHDEVEWAVGLFYGFVWVIASAPHRFLYLNNEYYDIKNKKNKKKKKDPSLALGASATSLPDAHPPTRLAPSVPSTTPVPPTAAPTPPALEVATLKLLLAAALPHRPAALTVAAVTPPDIGIRLRYGAPFPRSGAKIS